MTDAFEPNHEEITISYKGGPNYKEGLIAYKGKPEDAAKRMGIDDWDGRLSSLLERHALITTKNQEFYGGNQGKSGGPVSQ